MPGNLPAQLTGLVGRQGALSELSSLLWRTRLLTLCGPGGAGKSRLTAAVAEAVQADFVGGAWWVDLSSTLGSELVLQAVATAVLKGEPANDPTAAAIARRFSESSLLVLDNCEQIADACAELVTSLLGACQALRVVATSRRPLGVPGEQVWRVPGLDVGPPTEPSPAAERVDHPVSDAVELFNERATEAASSFDPEDPKNREAVERICRWLDGMPLALELAAARVPMLGVTQIAERLERDSGFLRRSSGSAPARHRTLQAALEWSHQMLEPVEQRLFRMLGCFQGTFSLAAAEAVGTDDLLRTDDILDLLGVLVDGSLVHVVEDPHQPRYKLLGPVRQFATEALRASGVKTSVRERHARYFLALAQDAQAGVSGSELVDWLQRIELEHENLREALRWLIAESPQDGAHLASLLWPFWYGRGYYQEARMWFEQTLESEDKVSGPVLVDVLTKAGEVAFLQCDYSVAILHLQRALEVAGRLDDDRGAATALQRLGSIAREQGRFAQARELHERSLQIWEQFGDRHGIAASQNYLGFVGWLDNDPWTAESLCTAALGEFRRAGKLQEAAGTLVNLGACALYRGELKLASDRLQEALAISRRLGFQEGIAWSEHELAILGRRKRHPLRENAALLRSAVLVHRRLGDRWRLASVLEEISEALLARQDPRLALELLAAAEALREKLGTPIPPAEASDRDAAVARLKAKLSPTVFSAAWSDGAALEIDLAIDRAVEAIDLLIGATRETAGGGGEPILTPRELAVLELISEGLTNREIAAALYISPSTAGVHVSNILRKLGAKRRVDAARLAHKLGLLPTR